MVKKQICILLLALSAWSPAYALTRLEAAIDRNPVMEGEYFVLNISADDEVDTAQLDTSALLKDFIVGRTSVSRSTQIINFNTAKETRWQILLSPKQQGQLTIPAFTLDGVSSAPIPLKVVESGSQTVQTKNLFIDASLSSDEAYVGQLLTYRVKLYLAVELQRGVLNAPVVEGAQIKQIGEDKDGSEIVDGRRYRVIERTYGLIPDLPGQVNIQGATFAGDVLVESQRRGGMFAFNESRPMQAGAPALTVQVNPPPASFQGQWLVADLVALKETFPEEITEFTLGNPITRTLTLLASNADENSLPDIPLKLPEALKQYPEKPQRQSFVRDTQIVSQYSITTAIVPTQAGTFTLPEITVPWWNPHLKRQELATLPARTIVVKGSPQAQATEPSLWQSPDETVNYWPWISALLATLWLVTLVAWRRALNQVSNSAPLAASVSASTTAGPASDHNGLAALERACAEGNASTILGQLQRYFSQKTGQSLTLDKIAARSVPLAQAISQLQACAYGANVDLSQEQQQQALALAKAALLKAVLNDTHDSAANAAVVLVPLHPN
ncbi:MAG: BatD family protein [Shewanella sp.]